MNKQKMWSEATARVLKRDGYKCRLCGSQDKLDVHHFAYDMFDKGITSPDSDKHLITLCHICHAKISGATSQDTDRVENRIDINVKAIRKELGLTQDKLAAKLGVAPFTVRRWESGKSHPSPLALQQLERLNK